MLLLFTFNFRSHFIISPHEKNSVKREECALRHLAYEDPFIVSGNGLAVSRLIQSYQSESHLNKNALSVLPLERRKIWKRSDGIYLMKSFPVCIGQLFRFFYAQCIMSDFLFVCPRIKKKTKVYDLTVVNKQLDFGCINFLLIANQRKMWLSHQRLNLFHVSQTQVTCSIFPRLFAPGDIRWSISKGWTSRNRWFIEAIKIFPRLSACWLD